VYFDAHMYMYICVTNRSSSLRYHPDKKGGSPDAFARVALAHTALGDAEQKEEFDSGLRIPASYADPDDIKRGLVCYFTFFLSFCLSFSFCPAYLYVMFLGWYTV
jgi:curved DNA-binding protein CbpA